MKLQDKIKWRIKLLPKIFLALIKETQYHPWKLIFSKFISDELFLLFLEKYGKSLVVSSSGNYLIADTGLLKVAILDRKDYYINLADQYFDLIYPYAKKRLVDSLAGEGPYEKDSVVLKYGDYVIDAGANLGIFSIFASQRVGENGMVYAFEPVEEIRDFSLRESVRLNNVLNIQIEPYALGGADKKIRFFLDDYNIGGSSGFESRGHEEIVEQITLDKFVKENNIQKINFIKIDVEGMERNLLTGAESTIKKFKPKIAICIYHRPDDPQILQEMLSNFVPEYRFTKTKTKLYAWVNK